MRKTLLFWATMLLVACEKPSVPNESVRPPHAEFLLAAGDSTFWVRSDPSGIRVRSAPILLTRTDNHFYEVYLVDDSRDYEMATFAWVRLFSRDIQRSDSTQLFDDGRVLREATTWASAHRDAPLLKPDEVDDTSDPPTMVSDDIEIVDVHGPWLTFGHHLDVDVSGRKGHTHVRRRGVVDVRNGTRATLASLFGNEQAKTIVASAQRSFAVLRDSIRNTTDQRGELARTTLSSFVFDSQSFGITDIAKKPAVAFMVAGAAPQGDALSLYLPPISTSDPAWWSTVTTTLPAWSHDSSALRWTRSKYDVVAHASASGDALNIVLASHDGSRTSREWPIASVPSPAYQLISLDEPPLDSASRLSLSRAFDQSTLLASSSRRVSWQKPLHKKREFRFTSYHTP